MKPNFEDCQECPKWDDVNGCWNDCSSFLGKSCEHADEDDPSEDGPEEGMEFESDLEGE